MKQIEEKIRETLESLSKSDDSSISNQSDWLSFTISLIPIPVVQQIGQLANKLINDKKINNLFEQIRSEIEATNSKIAEQEVGINRLQEIIDTIGSVDELQKFISTKVELLVELLKSDYPSEFVMETSDWSVQVLVKQLIDVDWAAVIAEHYSQNILKDTQIKAKRTHLKATDHSTNIIDGTEFSDESGTVKMDGIRQKGYVSVTGNSLNFHGGGELIFSSKPNTLNGTCPNCKTDIVVSEAELAGKTHIQCPGCKEVYRFQ